MGVRPNFQARPISEVTTTTAGTGLDSGTQTLIADPNYFDDGKGAGCRIPGQRIRLSVETFSGRSCKGIFLSIEVLTCQSIHLEDFKHLHETPCARPAFLYGIGSAFILGGVQLVLGASMRKATSWGLGGFLGMSVVVFEGCHYQRERAKERIKLI